MLRFSVRMCINKERKRSLERPFLEQKLAEFNLEPGIELVTFVCSSRRLFLCSTDQLYTCLFLCLFTLFHFSQGLPGEDGSRGRAGDPVNILCIFLKLLT